MAKPKGADIVGWSTNPAYEKGLTILAEKDVDQKSRRKTAAETWSSGHTVRQLGLAKRPIPRGAGGVADVYFIYTHSQVSNGASFRYQPPAFVGINREDMEWLVVEFLKELTSPA